jgi:hypothetical protein
VQAPALLDGYAPGAVLADKGYDSDALVAQIAAAGAEAVIPSRRNRRRRRTHDANLYADRNARADERPDRALLRSAEALPPCGDALREAGSELPQRRVSGLDADLAPVIVHTA